VAHRTTLREPSDAVTMTTVCKRAPTRIDFGGGWTDVPPYCDMEGGFVCNVAIARYSTVRVTAGDRDDLEIHTDRDADRSLVSAAARRARLSRARIELHNDFPLGAGLGGSSAAGVALAAALAECAGERLDRSQLAERSRATEIQDLVVPGGRQDHYAAAYGGALGLRFTDHVEVIPLPMSDEFRAAVERRALLVYTGESRVSGGTITAVLDAYRGRDAKVVFALKRMKELALDMTRAVRSGNLDALAGLVGEHWAHQRALHPSIPTERIDTIIDRARSAGAQGAKALGASGGGCVLVISPDDRLDDVRAAVAPLGTLVPYTVDRGGVSTCE
jgi:D-glycero-alpha-D-manno-heptose-7-phosphate kinase